LTDQPEKPNAARLSDDDRAVLLEKAISLFQSGQAEPAEPIYKQLLTAGPDDIQALIGAALCASTLRRDADGALALLDHAARLDPDNSHVHQSRAATLNMLGDFPGAVEAARKAIELNPYAVHAYVNLTDSMKVAAGDPLFDQANTALKAKALPDHDRAVLHFALGKAHQDAGDFDQAFHHFDAGNKLNPAFTSAKEYQGVADRQKALFSPDFCAKLSGAVNATPKPILIIGMPRSGTTLLERMLTAHPEVSTAGERPDIHRLSADFYQAAQKARPDIQPKDAIQAAMTRDNLANLARAYLTSIVKAADAKSPNIIDKMPTNFWHVGLVAAVFAKTPILHMRRHPLDTCLSNYLANFRTGLEYSNRLETLGLYFRLYDDLMTYWSTVLPGRILPVNYETLVAEPEAQMRRILTAYDLDWHEGCVHPEETKGVIATASRWQARQKINTSSVQKWRRYEKHLDPLVEALGGWDWIEGYEAKRFDDAAR